jgi:hypothetical protein
LLRNMKLLARGLYKKLLLDDATLLDVQQNIGSAC